MKKDEKMMESFVSMDKNTEIARVSFSMEDSNYTAVLSKLDSLGSQTRFYKM